MSEEDPALSGAEGLGSLNIIALTLSKHLALTNRVTRGTFAIATAIATFTALGPSMTMTMIPIRIAGNAKKVSMDRIAMVSMMLPGPEYPLISPNTMPATVAVRTPPKPHRQ